MCNEAARRVALGLLRQDFNQLRIPLRFPDGLPNLEPTASVRITDKSPIVRLAASDPAAPPPEPGTTPGELVMRRWSWPLANGKPLYNFRSEGRRFGNTATGGRCLIPLDGFYEFSDPAPDPAAPPLPKARARKDKWCFTLTPAADPARPNPYASGTHEDAFFCIAGLWRRDAAVGEAFTMLTCEPGPDVAPYHARQVVLLPAARWGDWIAGVVPAAELIAPVLAGVLRVDRVAR